MSQQTRLSSLVALYRTPFSAAYWRQALADFKQVRVLTFSALMIAFCVALSYAPTVVIAPNLEFTWGFLVRSVCSMVGGPINALVFGLAEDTISFLVHPKGAYFPGYALTTMLGNFIYALFLYRAPITLPCIAIAKLLTNVQNVFLGSLWSYILYGKKTYWAYMAVSAVKNTVSYPLQVLMLFVLFSALLPILRRGGLLPWYRQEKIALR